jgi:hypothetical protein
VLVYLSLIAHSANDVLFSSSGRTCGLATSSACQIVILHTPGDLQGKVIRMFTIPYEQCSALGTGTGVHEFI